MIVLLSGFSSVIVSPQLWGFSWTFIFFHVYTIRSCWFHQREPVASSFGVRIQVPLPFRSLTGHPMLSFHPLLSQNNQGQKKKNYNNHHHKNPIFFLSSFYCACLPRLLDCHGQCGLCDVFTSGFDLSVWRGNERLCILWCCRDVHPWSLSQEVRRGGQRNALKML